MRTESLIRSYQYGQLEFEPVHSARRTLQLTQTRKRRILHKDWPRAQGFASFLQTGRLKTFKLAPVQLVPRCATFPADFARTPFLSHCLDTKFWEGEGVLRNMSIINLLQARATCARPCQRVSDTNSSTALGSSAGKTGSLHGAPILLIWKKCP